MRISIIGPAHPLRGGGISSFNERMAQGLQQMGHTVDIYSFSLQYPSFLFPGKSQFTDEPAPENLNIHSEINSISPLNWVKVGRKIARQKPDLVILRFWIPFMAPCLGTMARIIKTNGHSRLLCIADNITPHEKRWGDELLLRYFLPSVDRYLTMSRSVLADLQSRTPRPAIYHPHPLYDLYGEPVDRESACRHLGLDPAMTYLLFFGFIRHYKGLDILLESLALLKSPPRPFRLIIAGEYYENRNPYQHQIREGGLADKIIGYEEFIPNSEIKNYFGAADLVVLPYRSATQSGIIPLAYHFERPVLVTRVGGLDEVVRERQTGFLSEPRPEALSEKIREFLEMPSDYPWVRYIGEEKKKYQWEPFLQNLLDFAMDGEI